MNAVFLDTVGIQALLERSDQWHEAATRVWATLSRAGWHAHDFVGMSDAQRTANTPTKSWACYPAVSSS